jgi:cell division protein ZapA
MAQVTLNINGKDYGIACDEGQEQRVIDLAHYIDEKVKTMIQSGAAKTENHALVLASLIIADEHFDLLDSATTSNANSGMADHMSQKNQAEDEARIAHSISTLADRIDAVAEKMKAA